MLMLINLTTLVGNLGINEEVVPNEVLDLGSCQCSWLKPQSLRSIQIVQRGGGTPEKVPNHDFLGKLLQDYFTKEGIAPMEVVMVASVDPTKFVHDESRPPPSSMGLNAVPNTML